MELPTPSRLKFPVPTRRVIAEPPEVLPIETAPVEVPVLIFVVKLELLFRLMAAPDDVNPVKVGEFENTSNPAVPVSSEIIEAS